MAEYNADTWKKINTGLPDVPVNCIEQDTQTRVLYAGTDIGVYYQNTIANATWLPFTSGMPATTVYDLGINYKAGTIWAASFGRGMWKSPKQYFTNSVEEHNTASTKFAITPNPNNGQFRITTPYPNKEISVSITDYSGKTLYRSLGHSDGTGTMQINFQPATPGIYFADIFTDKKIVAREKIQVE